MYATCSAPGFHSQPPSPAKPSSSPDPDSDTTFQAAVAPPAPPLTLSSTTKLPERPPSLAGLAGLAWAPGGRPRVVFDFEIEGGRVVAITLIADPDHLNDLELELLDQGGET